MTFWAMLPLTMLDEPVGMPNGLWADGPHVLNNSAHGFEQGHTAFEASDCPVTHGDAPPVQPPGL